VTAKAAISAGCRNQALHVDNGVADDCQCIMGGYTQDSEIVRSIFAPSAEKW